MNITEHKQYFNSKPVEYIPMTEKFSLKEDNEYIPRFKLKDVKEIADVPINEPLKPTQDLFIKSIKYGLIFLIAYKGAKDNHFSGHERVIYPMVIGKSSEGKMLIRGYHLSGWSVSNSRHINKIWRMFRMDRVLSMTFTGSFYRLPPNGYNMEDKGMRGGIIAKADFNEIRKNQQALVKSQEIQNKSDIELTDDDRKFATIRVKSTETKLDLNNPLDNSYINNVKDVANIRISFLKSIYGSKHIAILNSTGQPGNTVKVLNDKGINIGIYRVLDSINGEVLKKIKKVRGNAIFDVYIFEKKI